MVTTAEMVLTVDDACRALSISRGLGYQLVREGKLPSVRLGRRIVIPREALQRMLDGDGQRSAA